MLNFLSGNRHFFVVVDIHHVVLYCVSVGLGWLWWLFRFVFVIERIAQTDLQKEAKSKHDGDQHQAHIQSVNRVVARVFQSEEVVSQNSAVSR